MLREVKRNGSVQENLNEWEAFFAWMSAIGEDTLPAYHPEHMRALFAVYRKAGAELAYLRENRLPYSFATWLIENDKVGEIPALPENPNDPESPDATAQLSFIARQMPIYEQSLKRSIVYRPMNLNEILDDLLTDPQLAPVFNGRKKALI